MKTKSVSVPETKNVGIWIRVSTEDQAKGESPEHHLARAQAYAAVKGWTVKEVYDLAGVSGKSVIHHADAKRMLADIKRGHITGLIFSKLARLARNTRELLDFADMFRDCGADMVSLQETIDTSTPSGRLFFTMIAAMAQWEREEITDRVNASVAVRAKLGKPLSGVSPYGYRWKDKKLIIDPAEAPIRKQAYELFAQHRRKGFVAKLMNNAGHRTRVGAKWSDMAIGRIIRCSSAKGIYQFNRTRQTGNWTSEPKPESEWGCLEIVPIVPEALWHQCNQILEEQQKKQKRPGPKPVQLFGGLTFCACGHKMYVKANSPKYVCQKCLTKIPVVDLEAIVYDELRAFFTAPESIAKHFKEAHQNRNEKEQILRTHQDEIAKVRDEMERTHRLYLDGGITSQGYGHFYKPAEERLNQLTAELPRLEAELDHLKVNGLSAEDVLAEAGTLYARWPKMHTDEKRKIIEAIIEKITIGKDEIDVTFAYLPSTIDVVTSQQALLRR